MTSGLNTVDIQCCNTCGKDKPLDAFGYHKKRGKHNARCKACDAKAKKKAYWDDPESQKERSKENYKKNTDAINERHRGNYKKNKKRDNARRTENARKARLKKEEEE